MECASVMLTCKSYVAGETSLDVGVNSKSFVGAQQLGTNQWADIMFPLRYRYLHGQVASN